MADNVVKCKISKDYNSTNGTNTLLALFPSLSAALVTWYVNNMSIKDPRFLGGAIFVLVLVNGIVGWFIYDNITKKNKAADDFIKKTGVAEGNGGDCDRCFLYSKNRNSNLVIGWGIVISFLALILILLRIGQNSKNETFKKFQFPLIAFLMTFAISCYLIFVQGQEANDRKYYEKDSNDTSCSDCLGIKDKAGLYATNVVIITILGILWGFWKRTGECKLDVGFGENLFTLDTFLTLFILLLIFVNFLSAWNLNDKANKLDCKDLEFEEKFKHVKGMFEEF